MSTIPRTAIGNNFSYLFIHNKILTAIDAMMLLHLIDIIATVFIILCIFIEIGAYVLSDSIIFNST
jgi:hypothetical protein